MKKIFTKLSIALLATALIGINSLTAHTYYFKTFAKAVQAYTGNEGLENNGSVGLVLDASVNLYMSDYDNSRISELSPESVPVANFTANTTSVCVGSTVQFTDTSSGSPTSWQWSFPGGTPSTSTSQNPVITYNTAGNYNAKLIVTNGSGTDSITKTHYIYINPLPTITVTTTAAMCSGTSDTLVGHGGIVYSWSNFETINPIIVSPGTATSYTVTGTNSLGCSNTASLTVNPAPTITASPSAASICSGGSVVLSVNGATTYSWTPATGLSTTTGSSSTASPSVTTTYTITGTSGSGCTNTTSVTVTVDSLTVTVTSLPSAVCSGSSTILTGNVSGGSFPYTYSWSDGETTYNITDYPTSSTSYTITMTDANGCSNTASETVTVNPLPSITITGMDSIVSGTSDTLTASGGTSYVWSSGSTTDTTIVSPTTTTTYSVTASNSFGCSAIDSFKVSIEIPPIIDYYISTVTGSSTTLNNGGTGSGEFNPHTGTVILNSPTDVAVDAAGNIFIADAGNNRIREVSTSGTITTIAGNSTAGYSGDGATATAAELNHPTGIALDASGNIYIADQNNNRIREINTSGIISTIVGNGTAGYSGDGSAATAAELNQPSDVCLDASGNIYIADKNNNCIRKASTSGTITTIAGNNTAGYSGDGSAATAAELNQPTGVSLDASGNIYIADAANNRIRKVSSTGIIKTIIGNGTAGFSGDGAAATAAELNQPSGVSLDASGNIFITDANNNRIREVTTSGNIITIAGNGTAGYSGDGSLGTAAELDQPIGITLDASKNIYIADKVNNAIRELTSDTTTITTSIATLSENNNTNLYPNPSNTIMNLSFTMQGSATNATINVLDVTGKSVLETNTEISNGKTIPINISQLSTGIYFVKITTSKISQTIKFVKTDR